MADVATHNDIISALDGGDNEFAAVLLKDRLFHEPTDHKSWHLLARYFIDIEMAPFAYPVAQACVQREPTWRNLMMLGAAEAVLQMPDQAQASFRKAMKRMPADEPEKHKAILYRLMASASVQGYAFDKAEHWARKSLEIESHHQAHTALGFAKLHQRQWEEGWRHYAHQLGHNEMRKKHDYGIPDWQGEPDANLLVYGDQGLGDQIAYMSAIDPARISQINCHPKLATLFDRSFADAEVHGDMFKTNFDWHLDSTHQVSMATAMQWSKMRRRGRFLNPMREKVLQWSGLLAAKGTSRPRVGIAWTGGNVGSDGWRSRDLTLDQLEPLLRLPFMWVSLEYKDRTEEIEAFTDRTGIPIHDWQWATITSDYDDTAALVDCLDAIVTVPTTAYHLAGGLAVPACVLVHNTPHFHEGMTGECPWWQSVDFIRRAEFEDDAAAIDAAGKWLMGVAHESRRAG